MSIDVYALIAALTLLSGAVTLTMCELWTHAGRLRAWDWLLAKLRLVPAERIEPLLREHQRVSVELCAERAHRHDECNRLSYELNNARARAQATDAALDELRNSNQELAKRVWDADEITQPIFPVDKSEEARWLAEHEQTQLRKRKEQS